MYYLKKWLNIGGKQDGKDDDMLKEKLDKVFAFLEIPQSIRSKFYTTQ